MNPNMVVASGADALLNVRDHVSGRKRAPVVKLRKSGDSEAGERMAGCPRFH